jgi:hypothetical protein
MEHVVCGTKQDIDLDAQLANDTLLCMYAEFSCCCNQTAHVFAAHSGRPRSVYVSDLIFATRFNVTHRIGFLQKSLPLIRFILENNYVPLGENLNSESLVDRATIDGIFRHLSGARTLSRLRATSEDLGNALYRCFLTGCALNSDEIPKVETPLPCSRDQAECEVCFAMQKNDQDWASYNPSDHIEIYLKEYCNQLEMRLTNSVAESEA